MRLKSSDGEEFDRIHIATDPENWHSKGFWKSSDAITPTKDNIKPEASSAKEKEAAKKRSKSPDDK